MKKNSLNATIRLVAGIHLAWLFFATTVLAATYTVNSTLHGTDANGATTTLVEAIQQANTAGGSNTIELVTGTVYESNDTNFMDGTSAGRTMYPAITTTILLRGNGATLDASGKTARFFFVSGSGKLIVEDLNLTGGKVQGGDGAGGNFGGGGGGAGMGGAIFVNGSSATLIMRRSSITGCLAKGGVGVTSVSIGGNGGGGGGMGGAGDNSGGGGPRSAASGNTGGDGVGGNGGPNAGGFGGGGGGGTSTTTAGAGGFGGGGGGGFTALPNYGSGGNGGFGGGGGGTVTPNTTPFASGGTFGGRGAAYNSSGFGAGGGGAGLGGAIFNYQGSVTLENVTLSGNNATGGNGSSLNGVGAGSGAGGAIFNYDGFVTLKHVTAFTNIVGTDVAGNNPGVATGGAVYNYDAAGGPTASLTIYNSILANSTFNNASGVDVFSSGSANVSGAANSSLITSSTGVSGTVLTANPQLGLPERKNGILLIRPMPGSAALDAGDAANGLATDAGGTARPQGSGVDIGAAEGAFALSLNITTGMLLVGDSSARAIFAIDPTTGNRTLVSRTNYVGTGPDLAGPRGIAVDGNKNIYVVNTTPVIGIIKIDPATGNRTVLSSSAAGVGTGPGIFTPSGIAIRSTDGKLLVTDTGGTNATAGSDSVLVIDPVTGNRTLLSDDVTPNAVNPLTTANTIIYHSSLGIVVADNTTADTLTRVDGSTGARTIFSSATFPDAVNPFTNPQGIVEDTDGSILLIESTTTAGANRQLLRVNKTTGARTVVANLSTNLAYAGVTAGASGIYITKTTASAQVQKVNASNGAVTLLSGNTMGDGVLFGNNAGSIGFNIGLALIPPAPTTPPTTNYVTSLLDDGSAGSLRKMLATANTGDTLQFSNSLNGQTILLTGGQLTVTNTVIVDASGLTNGLTLDGNNANRIFEVLTGGSLTLKGVTIARGYSMSDWGGGIRNGGTLTLAQCTLTGNSVSNNVSGGAIFNYGTLHMWECTLTNNFAGYGGAVENGGVANCTNCTFALNTAAFNGGGVENNSGTLMLNQCTVSGNTAAINGGGVLNFLGTTSLRNTIVGGNNASSGSDIFNYGSSTIVRIGANLVQNFGNIGTDSGPAAISAAPLLAPIGNYGGRTHTMPPLVGSPAYNAAVSSSVSNDQRGLARPYDGVADLGAVEGSFNAAIPFTNLVKQVNGPLQFAFTNLHNVTFTVLATTNLASPFTNWSVQGVATEITPGQYQFADSSATNSMQKFYRLAAGPDALTRWASSVIAYSTAYGANFGDQWSVSQALGLPNTYPRYGDIPTAWSATLPDGTNEYIALGFAGPSPISSISMYETLAPGAAAIISVRNANNGQWVQVWTGTAAPAPLVSRIFTVNFPRTAFPVDGVKIEQDSVSVPNWNEIDAVSIRW